MDWGPLAGVHMPLEPGDGDADLAAPDDASDDAGSVGSATLAFIAASEDNDVGGMLAAMDEGTVEMTIVLQQLVHHTNLLDTGEGRTNMLLFMERSPAACGDHFDVVSERLLRVVIHDNNVRALRFLMWQSPYTWYRRSQLNVIRPLVEAASCGAVEAMTCMVTDSPPFRPFAPMGHRTEAFLAAARGGFSHAARYLCALPGVNPSSGCNRALCDLCGHGCVDAVRRLLALPPTAGVDVAVCDNEPLQAACRRGHLPVVRVLLEEASPGAGVDPACQNNTCVRVAAREGHTQVVRYLVDCVPRERGVDPAANDSYALRIAVVRGHVPLVRYLLQEVPASRGIDPAAWRNDAIRRAAATPHPAQRRSLVRLLVRAIPRGVDVAADQNFALRTAAAAGDADVFWLLAKVLGRGVGVRVEAREYEAVTKAVENGHWCIVRECLAMLRHQHRALLRVVRTTVMFALIHDLRRPAWLHLKDLDAWLRRQALLALRELRSMHRARCACGE